MPNYEYAKAGGGLATTNDQSNAPGIDPNSGFRTLPDNGSISSSDLASNGAIKLPTPPPPTNFNGAIANGNAVIGANTNTLIPPAGPAGPADSLMSLFDKYMGAQPTPPSASETYSSLYKTSGIDAATTDFNNKSGAVKASQSKLAAINASLQGINAEATSAQLSAEGRQAPMFAIAGEQGAIDRSRAIKAIPLQIQALTTQAELAANQGDQQLSASILSQAKDHLDRVFTLHMQDATNAYNYTKDILSKVYEFANMKEKARIESLQKEKDQNFQLTRDNTKFAQDLAIKAYEQGDTSVIAELGKLDPTSPSYATDVARIGGKLFGNSGTGTISDPVTAASNAILGNESNGSYTSVSPVLKGGTYAGQRSYGKYQVLQSNIPAWTKQFYGQSLTTQEFLNNPAAQEAVQRGKMGELWNKYGNIQDVASVYFTGVPYAQAVKEGRRDQGTGMTVQDYVAKAEKAFNASTAPGTAPTQSNPAVDAWVKQINGGRANLSDVPTTMRNAVAQGLASAPSNTDTKQLETINSVATILANPALDKTFGFRNALNRIAWGSEGYKLSADINNLTQNLALAARGQLKGQGQVSDFEGKMLKEAQTALKLNMSPDQARQELIKVQGALRTSSGLTASVKITDPKTGESQVLTSDQSGINKAIRDGLTVEYQ